jgi:hypothetical protein
LASEPSEPSAPVAGGGGVAVVALSGAANAAWPLAQAVYASPALRPASIDDAHARILCGERAPSEAPADVRDLAETVAALRGDDAPSRTLLGDIARRFAVRAVVVVFDGRPPSARIFLSDAGEFDAATYAPDPATAAAVTSEEGAPQNLPPPSWSQALRSLARAYGSDPRTVLRPPALATHERPGAPTSSPPSRSARMFYESGWFWGALGAAAFAGAAAFLATRDSQANTIHLQVQVPR